jgi:hypothetical protein
MRETSIQVLPAPAQASTATLRRGLQAIAKKAPGAINAPLHS